MDPLDSTTVNVSYYVLLELIGFLSMRNLQALLANFLKRLNFQIVVNYFGIVILKNHLMLL